MATSLDLDAVKCSLALIQLAYRQVQTSEALVSTNKIQCNCTR